MSLEHPNVVPIYDAGDVDSRLYLAMRLVDGSDLRALLRTEGVLGPARAFAICSQVGAALDAAHEKGLVHCDVKPSNVLVDQNDHVYVADLGLSRRLEDQRPGDERSMGTPAYLAPEHIEGLPIDGRADVYALGCLLYECLTGELPFARDSRLAMAWAHLEEDPPRASERNPKLPGAIDDVLGKGLAKAPSGRYPSCAALLDDARQALGLARPPAMRRRRRLLLTGVVLAAVSAGALAVFAFRGEGSAPAAPTPQPNSLLRVDPITNKLADVIAVQSLPEAVVFGGGSVWVWNRRSSTLSEVDASAAVVRRTIAVRSTHVRAPLPFGPILAGDSRGAWFIGADNAGGGFVARVLAGRRGKREFRIDVEPVAVAVGEGAVWVLGSAGSRDQLLRVDPMTGRITGRTSFARGRRLESLTAGLGGVWAIASAPGLLYRIDPRTVKVTGRLEVGAYAARPRVRDGVIWVGIEGGASPTVIVDPKTLRLKDYLDCCPPHEGDDAEAFGSYWMINWPTGVIVRWDAMTKDVDRTIPLVTSPSWDGLCLTAIATGGGSVWATVAPSYSSTCPS